MTQQNRVPCTLHIPHKEWAGHEEEKNYIHFEEHSAFGWLTGPAVGSLYSHPSIFVTTGAHKYDLHFPFPNWSNDSREATNYRAIEEWWSRVMTQVSIVIVQPPSNPAKFFDKFDLRIPYKDWATDLEQQNYMEIERWASYWVRHCVFQPIGS